MGTRRDGSIRGQVEIIKEQDERREYEINGIGQEKQKRRRWRQEGSRREKTMKYWEVIPCIPDIRLATAF